MMLMTKIHNLETGEEIEREMNQDELNQREANKAAQATAQAAAEAKAIEKAALLAKLGITAEEAALLLG